MIELNFAYGHKEDYTINPNPDNSMKGIRLIAAESFRDRGAVIAYNPIDFRKLTIQFIRNQKALIIYKPIDFLALVMQKIAMDIKFELIDMDSKLTTLVGYLRYNSGFAERLVEIKERLARIIRFNAEFALEIEIIQIKVVIVEGVLERWRCYMARDIANTHQNETAEIVPCSPDYIFRADQHPLEDLGYWHRFY